MYDWKTPKWHQTRVNLIEGYMNAQSLDCVDRCILVDLSELLLPWEQGATWQKELYPGINMQRRIDIDALEKKIVICHSTAWEHLNRLEAYGFYERIRYRSDRKMRLVGFRAMPLLARPERAAIPLFSPSDETMFENRMLINTYNDKSVNAIQVHLQRRIGCDRRLIKSGWIPGQPKYFHPKKQAEPDYKKYLKGHRYYQYGSYPLLSDGRTWLVEYDFDDSQHRLDEYHHTIQKQLACAGFSSIYAKRRPGRGHLIVSFSSPVDPEAAHQTLSRVAPALGVCQEVYPVGGKRNEKVSWPFYYVEDKKACECPMIAYFPGKLMEPVRCPGIRSDRGKVEYMFATAINDASLIQPLPPAPRKKPPLDMVSSNENIDREIEKRTFEAYHTVTEVLRMKVHDRFISPWRFPREDTPSAVVVSEHLVVDYGLENNPSGKPQYHGAWDCYVALKNGLIY